MKWAEIVGRRVNVRLPDLDLTVGKGEKRYFSEHDFKNSEYLQWAVQQGQLSFRWVDSLPNDAPIPPNYMRLQANRAPSQGASPSVDVSGMLAELIVKVDAARREQRELVSALVTRQDSLSAQIQAINSRLDGASTPQKYDTELQKSVNDGLRLLQDLTLVVEGLKSSGPVGSSSGIVRPEEDVPVFIPTVAPSKVGPVKLDIAEEESASDVGDAMAALRKHKTGK